MEELLRDWANEVADVFPDFTRSIIIADLNTTLDPKVTIERILDGALVFLFIKFNKIIRKTNMKNKVDPYQSSSSNNQSFDYPKPEPVQVKSMAAQLNPGNSSPMVVELDGMSPISPMIVSNPKAAVKAEKVELILLDSDEEDENTKSVTPVKPENRAHPIGYSPIDFALSNYTDQFVKKEGDAISFQFSPVKFESPFNTQGNFHTPSPLKQESIFKVQEFLPPVPIGAKNEIPMNINKQPSFEVPKSVFEAPRTVFEVPNPLLQATKSVFEPSKAINIGNEPITTAEIEAIMSGLNKTINTEQVAPSKPVRRKKIAKASSQVVATERAVNLDDLGLSSSQDSTLAQKKSQTAEEKSKSPQEVTIRSHKINREKKEQLKKPANEKLYEKMIVLFDTKWAESTEGMNIIKYLTKHKRYIFTVMTKKLLTDNSIEWRRCESSLQMEDITQEALEALINNAHVENFVFVRMTPEQLIGISDHWQAYCDQLRTHHPDKQITLLIIGLDKWLKLNNLSDDVSDALEETILSIQLESNCFIYQVESLIETSNFIELFTESIAESLNKFVNQYF